MLSGLAERAGAHEGGEEQEEALAWAEVRDVPCDVRLRSGRVNAGFDSPGLSMVTY